MKVLLAWFGEVFAFEGSWLSVEVSTEELPLDKLLLAFTPGTGKRVGRDRHGGPAGVAFVDLQAQQIKFESATSNGHGTANILVQVAFHRVGTRVGIQNAIILFFGQDLSQILPVGINQAPIKVDLLLLPVLKFRQGGNVEAHAFCPQAPIKIPLTKAKGLGSGCVGGSGRAGYPSRVRARRQAAVAGRRGPVIRNTTMEPFAEFPALGAVPRVAGYRPWERLF